MQLYHEFLFSQLAQRAHKKGGYILSQEASGCTPNRTPETPLKSGLSRERNFRRAAARSQTVENSEGQVEWPGFPNPQEATSK
jgi:hypothetical protein